MVNLDKLLEKEAYSVEKKKKPVIESLKIAREAYQKLNDIAKVLIEEEGRLEFYGYLISPREQKDGIVRDIYLPSNQEVNPVHVGLSSSSVAKAASEINAKGYKVLGWAHCHPGFSPHPSSTDRENNITILNQLLPYNQVFVPRTAILFNGKIKVGLRDKNKISLKSESPFLEEIEINYHNPLLTLTSCFIKKFRLPSASLGLKVPEVYGYALSLVVNGMGDYYAEVITKKLCSFCNHDNNEELTKLELELFEGGPRYTKKEIKEEILSKIRK